MCELDLEGHMGLELGEITGRRGGLQDGGIHYERSLCVGTCVFMFLGEGLNSQGKKSSHGSEPLLPPNCKGKKKKESELFS